MTALKQKYIRDLAIRGKAERTQHSYAAFVADLARYYDKSPDLLDYDQVADWLFHLIRERKLSSSSVNIAVNAARFFYGVTLARDLSELQAKVPHMKRETKRAHAYAVEEIEAILRAPRRPRDCAYLMTVYSCGLRLTEACTLQITDIDAARMQLRVRGKGAKERLCPLSRTLLDALKDYWRKERSGRPGSDCPWLFLGEEAGEAMCRATGQNIYYRAMKNSGVRRKGGIHVLRHSFATHLIESGVEITLVQRLLGHTSLLTTARYLHVTAPRLDRVRSALDLIDTSHLGKPAAGR
jgi:site-specific recombinase XerD